MPLHNFFAPRLEELPARADASRSAARQHSSEMIVEYVRYSIDDARAELFEQSGGVVLEQLSARSCRCRAGELEQLRLHRVRFREGAMSGEINVTNPDKPKKILMVIANPSTSSTLGILVGFWGAERPTPGTPSAKPVTR